MAAAAVALIALVFVLYTFWGGQVSVIRTDAWQLGLFVGGLVITLALVVRALAGGGPVVDGIAFRQTDEGSPASPVTAELAYRLEVTEFRGWRNPPCHMYA